MSRIFYMQWFGKKGESRQPVYYKGSRMVYKGKMVKKQEVLIRINHLLFFNMTWAA
jgi:hypothetical protein